MSDTIDTPTKPTLITLPEEPIPTPVVLPPPQQEQPINPPIPQPPSQISANPSVNQTIVETLLETQQPESVVVPPPPSSHQPTPLAKKSGKGPLLALIALLLLVLPVSVFFISQQNQQLSDVRSRAWGTGYKECGGATDTNPQGTCEEGYVCHCNDGEQCTETECELEEETQNPCKAQNRAWCVNQHGVGMTCCYPQFECNPNGFGCTPIGDDTGGDDTVVNTPTPTTGVTPVCQNIKLYKNDVQVTDLTTLNTGDDVVLAVKGSLSPTKAHFRINGGAWTETTAANNNSEFTLSYTIPSGITDFVIEGEVYTNGAWR